MSITKAHHFLSFLIILLLGTLVLSSGVQAQSVHGEPTNLEFRVDNATTGEPGVLDRLVISYVMIMPEVVIDVRPQGSEFEIADVPVKPDGRYIVTAWADGVPYFFARKGRQLVDGQQVLQVFSTSRDLKDVAIAGLNIVVRREGDLVHLEYLFQVRNDQRPQLTVFDPRATFSFFLPDGAKQVAAEYHRGPAPMPIPAAHAGRNAWELGAPLVSGSNRLRLTAVMPWREGLELPVGANLPVEAWSLLVTPDWLKVDARQLEPDPDNRDLNRLIGPALDARQVMEILLTSGEGQGGTAQNIFSDTAADTAVDDTAADTAAEGGGGLPLPLLGAALVLVILVAVARARRSS